MMWAAIIILGVLLIASVDHSAKLETRLDTTLDDLEHALDERNAAYAAQDAANENAQNSEIRALAIARLCDIAARHAVAGHDAEALAVLGELHAKGKL